MKVTFKRLRDLPDLNVLEIRDWYIEMMRRPSYLSLCKLYKENSLEYWKNLQRNFPSLYEYQMLKYRLQIFTTEFRKSMPDVLNPKQEETNDLSNSNS